MVRRALAQTLQQVCTQFGLSSLHITFPMRAEWEQLGEQHGFLQRAGIQYHFHNRRSAADGGGAYSSFDGKGDEGSFLASLRQVWGRD